jgi:hypothetical protein
VAAAWVRRDFGATEITQYPPGPHLSPPPPPPPASPAPGAHVPQLLLPGGRLGHYAAGARIALSGMADQRPDLAGAFARTGPSDIVVVEGGMDRAQQVLDLLGLRYTTVTTDAMNGRETADAVVGIRPRRRPHPLLTGVLDEGEDAQWWLEVSSYPILVLARGHLDVLLKSTELLLRWGAAPVALTFRHGRGEVFHMISHFYLQRTELRSARHATSADAYAAAKGGRFAPGELDGMAVGELESATASARLLANLVAEKRLRVEQAR